MPTALSPSSLANKSQPLLLHARRLFDGKSFQTDTSVLIENGIISKVGQRAALKTENARVIDLKDATLLPGFIDLHTHLSFQNVPPHTVLKHGITTVRELGGPLYPPRGGQGDLRMLTSGPIITAPQGYPIPMFGTANIATAVSSEEEARKTVQGHVRGGATIIKIALEPGGEPGAPWTAHHGHGQGHADNSPHGGGGHGRHHSSKEKNSHQKKSWPLLPENIVEAIVDEAHKNNRKVTAHLAEERGVTIALNAGVDEWAHMPCAPLPKELLERAAKQKITIVSTLDTLSKCSGIAQNASQWAKLGGRILYGAEIAHPDIPWGIDFQELMNIKQMSRMQWVEALRSATSEAGVQTGIPLLGTLQQNAPADIIAVKGDLTHNWKTLEYPDLVISGGEIITNNF